MFALPTTEQQMLAEMARSLGAAHGVKSPHDVEKADETKIWRALAETGLLGMRRRDGGVPLASGIEASMAAHEFGGALVPVPYVTSGVLALELLELARAGDASADALANGEVRAALLLDSSLCSLADLSGADADRAILVGRPSADFALALRPSSGGAQLVRVEVADAFVLSGSADPTTALSTRVAGRDLSTEDLGEPIGEGDLLRWTALALVLASSDSAGAIRAALDGVVEYSKERIAYDVPIGSFQALQHLCADAFTACEGAVTTNNYGAWAVDALEPHDALLAARTAKAWTASVARTVTETVQQVYGGIGHTWEHVAHLYARRVLLGTALFGNEAHQLDGIFELRDRQRRLTAEEAH